MKPAFSARILPHAGFAAATVALICLGSAPCVAAGDLNAGTAAAAAGASSPNASTPNPATPSRLLKRDLDKDFEDLTPSERIAIRSAAKAAYRDQRLDQLVVCADPGNMPFSDEKGEGFENKLAELLGKATGARVSFYWRPSYERGMTRETFDTRRCDAMIDIPTGYESLLTTEPIYRTTYVLASRADRNLHIKNFDDPALKKLKLGVFQTSSVREVLLRHGIFDNVSVHTVSHDADIKLQDQPWYQVQLVVDGKLDAAAVWGPFAGWVKAKGAPIAIQPVNLWEDTVPLEFDMAIGVRKTDALLKYILDFALEDHKAEIEALLKSYGVPLVQCSRCIVPGDLPAHGSYTEALQEVTLPPLPAAEEQAAIEGLKKRLAAGADPNQELSAAVTGNDPARIKLLVAKGADVNHKDDQGYTPLTSAARQRYTSVMELLLALKADANVPDRDGMTPLLESVMRDDVPSIKLLLAHGADAEKTGPQGYTPLTFAIEEQRYEAAKALIDAGAKVNVAAGDQRLTPLMIAVAENAPAEGAVFVPSSTRPLDVARALVQRGADVNAKDKDGTTALMIAASHDNAPMVGLLLQSGADASVANAQGQTALDIAKLNGSQEASRALSVLATVPTNGAPQHESGLSGSAG